MTVPQRLPARGRLVGQAVHRAGICLHSTLLQAAIPASPRPGWVLVAVMRATQVAPLPLRHAAVLAVLAAGSRPARVLALGLLPVLARILDPARAPKQAASLSAPELSLELSLARGLEMAQAQPSARAD